MSVRRPSRRAVLVLLAFPVALYVALVAGLYLGQRNYIYRPNDRRPDAATAGVPGLMTIDLRTEDGLTLSAWFLPPPKPNAATILFFHGNGGTIGNRTEHLRKFAAAGFGVLFPEYRGYGGNPGIPTEAGLFRDAAAAIAFLSQRGVEPGRIVFYGESLGTGVAVEAATEVPQAGAVILEAPYTSITAVASDRFPFVPVSLLLKDPFDSLARIDRIHAPLFVAQGAKDDVVPPALGKALFAAAREPKVIWVSPDAGHNDLLGYGATDAAIAFIQRMLPPT